MKNWTIIALAIGFSIHLGTATAADSTIVQNPYPGYQQPHASDYATNAGNANHAAASDYATTAGSITGGVSIPGCNGYPNGATLQNPMGNGLIYTCIAGVWAATGLMPQPSEP